jgi:hypothetical protein
VSRQPRLSLETSPRRVASAPHISQRVGVHASGRGAPGERSGYVRVGSLSHAFSPRPR